MTLEIGWDGVMQYPESQPRHIYEKGQGNDDSFFALTNMYIYIIIKFSYNTSVVIYMNALYNFCTFF